MCIGVHIYMCIRVHMYMCICVHTQKLQLIVEHAQKGDNMCVCTQKGQHMQK